MCKYSMYIFVVINKKHDDRRTLFNANKWCYYYTKQLEKYWLWPPVRTHNEVNYENCSNESHWYLHTNKAMSNIYSNLLISVIHAQYHKKKAKSILVVCSYQYAYQLLNSWKLLLAIANRNFWEFQSWLKQLHFVLLQKSFL